MPPGHNAFQRNAFQRNAFQIVYEFAPTVDGGLVLGGSTTSSFTHHYSTTVTGGLVIGGSILTRFHSGVVPPPPVRRLGTAGRVWRNILARPRHFRPKVAGGLALGGAVRSYGVSLVLQNTPIPVYNAVARVSGGIILGGDVETLFVSQPLIYISQRFPSISQTAPEPVSYKAVSALGGGAGLGGNGVHARFQPAPSPPEAKPRSWPFFDRHKAQRLEEDELILMDVL